MPTRMRRLGLGLGPGPGPGPYQPFLDDSGSPVGG